MVLICIRYGKFIIDFWYLNKCCCEIIVMEDIFNNCKKFEKVIECMEVEMFLGVFDYVKYFFKSVWLVEIKVVEN